MNRPPENYTRKVELIKVQDGDTVYVNRCGVHEVWKIRLKDCWADELSTPEGKAAKAYAQELLSKAKVLYCTVYLESFDGGFTDLLRSVTTMGRIIGDIWIDEHTTLSQAMVAGGHATAEK